MREGLAYFLASLSGIIGRQKHGMRYADAKIGCFIEIAPPVGILEEVWQELAKLAQLAQEEQRDAPHQPRGGKLPGDSCAPLTQDPFSTLEQLSGFPPAPLQKRCCPSHQSGEAGGVWVIDALR